MNAKRLNEYDVRILGHKRKIAKFRSALREAGLKVFTLSPRHIQVSFDGFPELREQLPPIGTEYAIGIPS